MSDIYEIIKIYSKRTILTIWEATYLWCDMVPFSKVAKKNSEWNFKNEAIFNLLYDKYCLNELELLGSNIVDNPIEDIDIFINSDVLTEELRKFSKNIGEKPFFLFPLDFPDKRNLELDDLKVTIETFKNKYKELKTENDNLKQEFENQQTKKDCIFEHNPDYTTVFLGRKFNLTDDQAKLIEYLHKNYLKNEPLVHEEILLKLSEGGSDIKGKFRSRPDSYNTLIRNNNDKKYKLNLPEKI